MITSYGICCFNISNPESPKLCVVESDYTYAFRDLINCKYEINKLKDDNFMETKVYAKMTLYEKKLILLCNFKILSVLSWNIGYDNYVSNYDSIEKKEEVFSEYIFNDRERLFRLICKSNYHYSESEILKQTIGIPKGRKKIKSKEDDYKVAMREFQEETNINKVVLVDQMPYSFINDYSYNTVYYIACTTNDMPCVYDHSSPDQFREIKNVLWVTEDVMKTKYSFLYKQVKLAFCKIKAYLCNTEIDKCNINKPVEEETNKDVYEIIDNMIISDINNIGKRKQKLNKL